jgi:hypothetical protein
MSSYLSRLIERTQGRAAALQRRQPALFESVTPWVGAREIDATGSREMDWVKDTQTRTAHIGEADDAHASVQDPLSERAMHATGLQPVPARLANAVMQVDTPPSGITRNAAKATIAGEDAVISRATTEARTDQQATAQHLARFHDTARAVSQSETHSPAETHRPDSPAPFMPLMPAAPVAHVPGIQTMDASPVSARTQAVAPQTTATLARPRVTPPSLHFTTPPAPQAAATPPAVHITIGRVEIRAITVPEHASPRTPKAAAPRLSLDDYLRTRGGSKR